MCTDIKVTAEQREAGRPERGFGAGTMSHCGMWNDASTLFTRGIPGVSLEAGATGMLSWQWAMSCVHPTVHVRG